MTKRSPYLHLIELNLAVLFLSTSGVLGKYIDLPVPIIIFMRTSLAAVILFLYIKIKGFSFKISREDRTPLFIGGFFMGVHFITYFYALKLSNVAIAMLSLYTFPTITAILEPLLLKSKFQVAHLLLGAMVLFGIFLLVPSFSFEDSYVQGIGLGLCSALVYSIRNIMLKSKVGNYNQSILMFNQLAVVSLLLISALPFFNGSQLIEYLPSTFLLALLTTAIGHTLFVQSLKHFSITSASLISSLQPIYGIILAFLFLKELPSLNTMIGGLVIISTVIIESIRVQRLNNKKLEEGALDNKSE